jgi:hypothetical protein
MNDIIQFIKDLEEIKRVAEIMLSGNNLDVLDNTIQKYQRIIDDFEESQDNLYNTKEVRNNA